MHSVFWLCMSYVKGFSISIYLLFSSSTRNLLVAVFLTKTFKNANLRCLKHFFMKNESLHILLQFEETFQRKSLFKFILIFTFTLFWWVFYHKISSWRILPRRNYTEAVQIPKLFQPFVLCLYIYKRSMKANTFE